MSETRCIMMVPYGEMCGQEIKRLDEMGITVVFVDNPSAVRVSEVVTEDGVVVCIKEDSKARLAEPLGKLEEIIKKDVEKETE